MHLARQEAIIPASPRQEKVDIYGLTDGDFELLNQLAFAAAFRGRVAEAQVIADAIEKIAPEHVAPVIARALLMLATDDRQSAIDLLYQSGLKKKRRWEEAAILLLQLLDPKKEAKMMAEVQRTLRKSQRQSELPGVDM